MSCKNVQERISLLLDGRVPAAERESVLAHTGVCNDCNTYLEELEMQRAFLRKMAQMPVPQNLAAQLQVMASHERQRQLGRVNVRERWKRVVANVELAFDNMMRP